MGPLISSVASTLTILFLNLRAEEVICGILIFFSSIYLALAVAAATYHLPKMRFFLLRYRVTVTI